MTFLRYLLLAVVYSAASCSSANGDLIIHITESGNDVLVNASGQLNMADATYFGSTGGGAAFIVADGGRVRAGTSSVDRYVIPIGPTSFGTGFPGELANSNSGDGLGVFGASSPTQSQIFVPLGYVSGDSLLATSLYELQSFTSLGLNEGSYVYSWGAGADADSLTVQIGAASVPEPSSLLLMGAGLAVFSLRQRKRISKASGC